MTYQSVFSNRDDSVIITIYDGEGGHCIPNAMLQKNTIRSGCYVTTVSVPVRVSVYQEMNDESVDTSDSSLTRK